ncbi:MAG TPA: adenylate/guanylate cyclase domain-containing protein [Solirubrobacteraceae bacterium]|jgi:adenylate cyclase
MAAEEEWRRILVEGHRSMVMSRRFWRHVPSAPRCKVCANPFEGIGGRIAAAGGWTRSRKNPNLCSRCCDQLPPGGAEVDVAVLFADVRGSTALGERHSASDFAALLNRFYATATEVILRHDGLIDKLIGDEAMALFIPGVAGAEYRRRSLAAARELLTALGYGSSEGPWLEVGVGLNAGLAFVGNVGTAVVDFTALGDAVNVAARLQAAAGPGQLVVAEDLLEGLALELEGERRAIETRGRQEPVPAIVAAAAAPAQPRSGA